MGCTQKNCVSALLLFALPGFALGQEGGDSAAEMARKLQDPLASIAAIMTDNDVLFKTGEDETSFAFQIQPVKAFSFESFNLIARGIVPISGIAPEGQRGQSGKGESLYRFAIGIAIGRNASSSASCHFHGPIDQESGVLPYCRQAGHPGRGSSGSCTRQRRVAPGYQTRQSDARRGR